MLITDNPTGRKHRTKTVTHWNGGVGGEPCCDSPTSHCKHRHALDGKCVCVCGSLGGSALVSVLIMQHVYLLRGPLVSIAVVTLRKGLRMTEWKQKERNHSYTEGVEQSGVHFMWQFNRCLPFRGRFFLESDCTDTNFPVCDSVCVCVCRCRNLHGDDVPFKREPARIRWGGWERGGLG